MTPLSHQGLLIAPSGIIQISFVVGREALRLI